MLPSWAKDWEQAIIEAEKFRLFTGSIGALIYDGAGKIDWSNFEAKYNNVKKYFANPDNPSAIRDMIPYIESNEPLNNTEIKALKYIEKTFNEEFIKQENEFKEWLKENNIEFNG